MSGVFHENGIHFQYPENWQLIREESQNGWTVTLQSPETGFFLLTYDADMPEVDLMVLTALDALREEYPDLEADEVIETLAGQPAIGHDILFFSFDLTNTCHTRSFYCDSGTVFMMWQANDLELDKVEPVFRAICVSLRAEEV